MPQSVGLLENALDIAGLGGLVLKPDLLQVLFRIFTLQKMPEDQLVLIDCLFRND